MRIILIASLCAFLISCGGGAKAQLIKKLYENRVSNANAGAVLPSGTLISWGCDGYTRLNEVADGQGGSNTETVERSPDCGWNPPEAGTVSETRCEDPYTLITVFNDGEYGFYEEEEENSEECGYVPPRVEPVKETGDRFDPVVFSYDPLLNEEPTIEVTIGRASFEDGQILIHGAGATGEGTLLVEGEEFRYTIESEPRCGMPEGQVTYDCQGYRYGGRSSGYIYYGEDDDRIVEWELAIMYYTNVDAEGELSNSQGEGVVEWITPETNPDRYDSALNLVDKYNLAYERSGIHIRYVLKKAAFVHYHGLSGANSVARNYMDSDVAIGKGSTCEATCGCAFPGTGFAENSSRAQTGVSVCGWDTDLHEIGHAVGLAHGPENSANPASGYIWTDFGHGWGPGFCAFYADIMSYNASTYTHWNSKLTCEDMFGSWSTNTSLPQDYDNLAGSREYADATYHLNRVRYDVSLINCEGELCADAPQSDQREEVVEEREPILDHIEKFEDGPERLERFLQENPQYRNMNRNHTHGEIEK